MFVPKPTSIYFVSLCSQGKLCHASDVYFYVAMQTDVLGCKKGDRDDIIMVAKSYATWHTLWQVMNM